MKLDTPVTTDVALGIQRRIIEPSDSLVDIPARIQTGIELIQPCAIGGLLSTTPINQSALIEHLEQLNNTGARNDVVCTLAPGLWVINLHIGAEWTFATAFGVNQVMLYKLDNGTFGPTIWSTYVPPNSNQWVVHNRYMRILTREQCTIKFTAPATAVGDFWNSTASIYVERDL